ncbi:calponin homology domain-containing protein [Obelidium mucronatum]|nr:calponin homology domain-containing protein [Obelidium mucronatum]
MALSSLSFVFPLFFFFHCPETTEPLPLVYLAPFHQQPMTESKTELLGWLNDLLQLNYTRIEQCGTGAAFCQIADSIYGNVPITRVKFQSDTEYDYISNFKILQSVFNKHKIERSVPIDKLVKCRYSDNLEFLQWMKKYWDAFYPGGRYDAAARRAIAIKPKTPGSAKSPGTPVTPAGRSPMKPNMTSERESRTPSVVNNGNSPHPKLRALSFSSTDSGSSYGALEKGTSSGKRTPQQHAQQPQQQSRITSNVNMLKSAASQQRLSNGPNSSTTPTNLAQQQERYINDLTRQVNDLKIAANTLERERNFYYLKLRDLEVLVLDKLESNEEVSFLHEIQTILYATEEGFIRPNKNNPPKLALAPITVATCGSDNQFRGRKSSTVRTGKSRAHNYSQHNTSHIHHES